MTRPLKGKSKLKHRWTILLTDDQQSKRVEWGEGAGDYVRTCIDTRYTGSVEEMTQRRDFIRKKVGELNLEAQELDNVIRTMEQDEGIAEFETVREEYEKKDVSRHDMEKQVAWLTGRWKMSKQQANEFLSWVNPDRSGEEDD